MKKTLLAVSVVLATSSSYAQLTQTNQCPPTATNCTGSSNQNAGDTATITNSGDTHSSATQLGNSSASNVSGATVSPQFDNKAQTTQTTTGTISGGNTTSGATGGSATGNWSDNKSGATTGASTSSVGATSSTSGGNILTSGPSTANGGNNSTGASTATGNGGSGGAGGEGGKGGSAAQQQGIDRSGNSSNKNANAQGQGQGQQQSNTGTNSQGQSSTNKLSNGSSSSSGSTSGGNKMSNGSTSGATSGGNSLGQKSSTSNDGSGNSSVDASNRSVYNNKTIFIPPIIPPTPASQLGVGNIIKETGTCGPLQRITARKVEGTFHGLFFDSKVDQGYTEQLAPYLDANGNEALYKNVPLPTGDGYRIIGHQVTQYTTIVGVSGARNIAIGGGGSSGSWGQGGLGTSSANQQLVTTLQLSLCDMGTVRFQPVLVNTEVHNVYVEVDKMKKRE